MKTIDELVWEYENIVSDMENFSEEEKHKITNLNNIDDVVEYYREEREWNELHIIELLVYIIKNL